MKVLITGSEGFIGRYLVTEYRDTGYDVVRCDLREAEGVVPLNILDAGMTECVLADQNPDILVNLAGQANVGLSWKKPQLTFQLNTIGVVNILEAVRKINPTMRVVVVGSSDEYGVLLDKGVNVTEDMPTNPMTPYAISKRAQEEFAQVYCHSYGMDICMTRQFNLGGAGQTKGFMISDFASGIAEIEAGQKEKLSVGNLTSARDFTHVKDASRAIRFITEKGKSGEVYNICSGKTYTAEEVLDKLINLAKVRIDVKQDPSRMRPSDTPIVCGNHGKLTAHTGWEPKLDLDQIVEDALEYWRNYFFDNYRK